MGLSEEDLLGARWSSAVICPRRCCYEAQEVEPSDDTPESLLDIFWRSTVLGNAYQARFRAEHPGWEVEVEAPWGKDPATGGHIGVGHADLAHEPGSKVVEVKVLSSKLARHHFVQVTGYVKFLGYDYAELHVIDPQSGKVTITPVNVETFMPEVDRILTTIEESLRLRTLPERVCKNPGSWQARGCAFRTKCFLGWVSDDLLLEDEAPHPPEAQQEAGLQSLLSLNIEITDARKHLQSLEGIREHLRSELDDLPRGEWITFADGMQVRISPVNGSTSLSVGRLEAAGYAVPAELQPFVTQGKGHERWSFKAR